ncbi:MAG: xanthine dehydrogenase family protein molybdopterin-binding subunit [Planctomycetota bacterium]
MTAPHAPRGTGTPRGEVELKLGFGDHVVTRKVAVPDGDAPPWDATTQFAVVGTDLARADGLPKASGRAKYSYDVTFPGMLQGMILRSTVARGVLTGLELDEARAMPGIAALIPLKEVGHRVRFVGDELVAVAARTLDQCRDALERIRATYEQEDHTVDFLAAADGPILDDGGELQQPWTGHEDLEEPLGKAAVRHQATYRTEVQTHSSLETHGMVARWNGSDAEGWHLELWASTQATFGVRNEIGRAMEAAGHPCKSVTVHSEYVGGGFGSKFTAGAEGRAVALLARAAKAPVKLMLDRFEEHTCAGNRPASLMQFRAGLDDGGRIAVFDWRSYGGVGHNGEGGAVRIPDHFFHQSATRPGRPDHKDVATDTDPARAMRAPGHPQGFFGCELFLDELAQKAGIDPLELRRRNDPQVIRIEQYRLGAERFGWQAARNPKPGSPMPGSDPRYLRGAGMASARWGQLGNHGLNRRGQGTQHAILCRIHPDGTVEVRSGAQDIGSGLKTVMVAIAAEELGVEPARVRAVTGHTDDPSGPASGGSTTTPSLAPAVRHAAFLARQQLAALAADDLGAEPAQIAFAGGRLAANGKSVAFADVCRRIAPNPIEARGVRFPNYESEPFERGVCGAQFAEVLVDSWTGAVRVTRMLALQDCGIVIARKAAESQVLGAMIQGIGYALHEQRILDRASGRMLNGDFLRYKIPGPADMPEMECLLQSVANGHSNTSAAGIGEPPSVAAPAAIANAVFNAIGAPVRHLPITPDKVLAALSRRAR